jgi:hypothetical protein
MRNTVRVGLLLLLGVAMLMGSGCIRSRVKITTDPPGANIRFRNVDYGKTPVEIPFVWYWYYDIGIEKEGYEKVETLEYFSPPPYAIFPLDFFSEILPVPITDTRERHYVLKPVVEKPE